MDTYKKMNTKAGRRVLYTSVFGNYDDVVEQNLLDNWDWK